MKAKVSSPLYISTLKTKKQHKKNTKHVEIIILKKNDPLFLNLISPFFLVHFSNFKCYVCTKLKSTSTI
jgi:hypothetical protein